MIVVGQSGAADSGEQAQSTLERSGGVSSDESQIKTQAAKELSQGKTAQAMKEHVEESSR